MKKIIPDAYYKDIFSIDYSCLKKAKCKVLIFDVDNTLVTYYNNEIDERTSEFLNSLKKDFIIIAMSNQSGKRIHSLRKLGIEIIPNASKPFKKSYSYITSKYLKEECIFIGDQISTDILGAKRNGFKAILVDGLANSKPIYTLVYRIVEKMIVDKKYKKGQYYNNIK